VVVAMVIRANYHHTLVAQVQLILAAVAVQIEEIIRPVLVVQAVQEL
jgi:hypothetical protein